MATLAELYADPRQRAKLPAGMRNNNPGNIKFVGQGRSQGVIGPSVNTDQGDPQAVFESPEAGMAAMYRLLMKKYAGGKTSANAIIAGNGGWTPGNRQAAANVARSSGVGPDDDIGLRDPARAARFVRGLIAQEHGNAGSLYTDAMINAAISGTPIAAQTMASAVPTPSSPKSGSALMSPQPIADQFVPQGPAPAVLGDLVGQTQVQTMPFMSQAVFGDAISQVQLRREAEAQRQAADQQRKAALFGGDLFGPFG